MPFKAYAIESGALKAIAAAGPDDLKRAIWIDLWDPTPAEIAAVERAAGVTIRLPETADRFYVSDQVEPSDGQIVLRALVLGGLDRRQPKLIPVTFIRASSIV